VDHVNNGGARNEKSHPTERVPARLGGSSRHRLGVEERLRGVPPQAKFGDWKLDCGRWEEWFVLFRLAWLFRDSRPNSLQERRVSHHDDFGSIPRCGAHREGRPGMTSPLSAVAGNGRLPPHPLPPHPFAATPNSPSFSALRSRLEVCLEFRGSGPSLGIQGDGARGRNG